MNITALTTYRLPPRWMLLEIDTDEIDILVNNTANDERHDFLEVSPAYFDAKLAIKLQVAFFAAQAVTPGMTHRGDGAIINSGDHRPGIRDRRRLDLTPETPTVRQVTNIAS